MFPHSIRWRLQLWLGFLLAAILAAFGVTAYQLNRTNQFHRIDRELERRVAALQAAVSDNRPGGESRRGPPPDEPRRRPPGEGPSERRPPPDAANFTAAPNAPAIRFGAREIRLSQSVMNLFDETAPDGFYFAVWSRSGNRFTHPSSLPAEPPCPERSPGDTALRGRERGGWREAYLFTGADECLLAGRTTLAETQALRRFAWLLGVAGTGVLALGLGGGWWLTTRAIRPVEDISAAASRIAEGNLSERITAVEPDNELGRLAGVLNNAFARLEAAFTQQKQFTADASHELRTPISVIISEAQTTLARERTGVEYRETIEANLAAAQQMRQLTENLLELARLDAGHESLRREHFDLAQNVRECVQRIRPLAVGCGIQIHCDLSATECHGDRDRVGQVITNLLTNAIHYNRDGGEVRLATRTENQSAILTVSDTGIGIAAEDLPHIFKRFYRADKSRSHSEGRSGLGLAISKAIVDAHGGGIAVSSEFRAGTTLSVRLPTESNPP